MRLIGADAVHHLPALRKHHVGLGQIAILAVGKLPGAGGGELLGQAAVGGEAAAPDAENLVLRLMRIERGFFSFELADAVEPKAHAAERECQHQRKPPAAESFNHSVYCSQAVFR